MKDYFKTQIGKKIKKSVVTGERFFTEVYQRDYLIEVLSVKGNKLIVEVNSRDIAPAGLPYADKDEHFGELTVDIKDKSKAEILNDIVVKMDPNFFTRYPKVLRAM